MLHQDDIRKLITNHNRRLQILKEQQALQGISTDPEILLEIEDIGAKIAQLQSQLETTPSIKRFSIDRPENDEELPLDRTESWILEGKFPNDLDQTVKIDVEVFKLPERLLIPQTGKPRISTVRGFWRFESVKFDGEGDYEIVITVSTDKESDYHSINVKCLQKATAYKNAIEKDREHRDVTNLVLMTPQEVPLVQLKKDLYQMQKQFFEFYPNDLDGALKVISRTLDTLDPVLPIFPNDLYLQNVRAYIFKNYAMVMQVSGHPEEAERALREAERMFEAIRQQNPEDAGAWNGLGSVTLLRKDPNKALYYIEKALEIEPHYEEAILDRNEALKLLGQ
ncbi:MAG: tetratricopeptide repeat protein [Anaerolineales bacterium]|nr:tetratricopeptide repeat protein [Anaerolineales bacterium]